jgi:hypothetical protein
MPQVGFERTILVFERTETIHALVRAVTLISHKCIYPLRFLKILLKHSILYDVYDFSTATQFDPHISITAGPSTPRKHKLFQGHKTNLI